MSGRARYHNAALSCYHRTDVYQRGKPMSEKKFLKPADGRKVRRPDGPHMRADGELVEMTTYWRRRLRAGEVVEAQRPAAPKKPAAKKTEG